MFVAALGWIAIAARHTSDTPLGVAIAFGPTIVGVVLGGVCIAKSIWGFMSGNPK
jgi:hypothetical protein